MKGGKSPLKRTLYSSGYTVIEVMIVLAISGTMFLMATTFINGKQRVTAFRQGSNELGSRIQKVIDDVTDGHYSDVPLACSVATGQATELGGAFEQGTNSDCVFLGKFLHFYKDGGVAQPTSYEILSVADRRVAGSTPTLPRDSIGLMSSLTAKQRIPQGLTVKSMQVFTNGVFNNSVYNIGFIQGSGEIADPNTGEYKSAAQTIQMVTSTDLSAGGATTTADFGNSVRSAKAARICVTDGTRYAQILIGGDGSGNTRQLGVRVKQLGEAPC